MKGPSQSPATEYSVEEPRAYKIGTAPPPEKIERAAVLLVHGMGQQVEFEGLDQLERGLQERERLVSRMGIQKTRVRYVMLGEQRLRRCELQITTPSGGKREVHLYEAYWAPMTEGRITIRDVSRLLWRASWVRQQTFFRWLFGSMHPRDPDPQTYLYVGLVWILVISLQVLYTIAALSVIRVLFFQQQSWLTDPLLADLAWPIIGVVAAAIALGAGLIAARWSKRRDLGQPRPWLETVKNRVVFFLLFLFGAVAIGGALWSVFVFLVHSTFDRPPYLIDPLGRFDPWTHFLTGVSLWVCFLWAGWKVRETLVQYVGDVAAYVSPNVLDRFADLRREIQTFVLSIANAIYSACEKENRWLYDRVELAGHSLGSVIAYETLNRLINEDLLAGRQKAVLARTGMFLTFGSPLDKTAYVFARQGERTADAREVLAASVQPALVSHANRTFRWVNIYSPCDIVSSPLKLYDDPAAPNPDAVENVEDMDAVAPLLAHVDYLRNPLLFKILHTALGSP